MLRIGLLLRVISSKLAINSGYAGGVEIANVNEPQSVFSLGGSEMRVEIVDHLLFDNKEMLLE